MANIIKGIEEEERQDRTAALYSLAAQIMARQDLEQEVSAEQLDQINRIGSTSSQAIAETVRPSPNDGKQPGSDALSLLQIAKKARSAPKATLLPKSEPTNSALFPTSNKAMRAAASSLPISNAQAGSLFTLAAEKPAEGIDSQAVNHLTNLATHYLQQVQERAEAGKFSLDQTANAMAVPRNEIAEHALMEAGSKLAKKEPTKELGVLHNYPNVAREMLQLGLKMEVFKTEQLEEQKKRGDEYRDKIQSLLKFSALLDKLSSEKESHNLKEALLDPLSGLEKPLPAPSMEKEEIEQCIKEIFPDGSYVISKEQLSGGKVRVNDIMGEYKTKMTNLLTTEISVVIHNLQMITQMMQEIGKKQHQLVSSIVSHFGGR